MPAHAKLAGAVRRFGHSAEVLSLCLNLLQRKCGLERTAARTEWLTDEPEVSSRKGFTLETVQAAFEVDLLAATGEDDEGPVSLVLTDGGRQLAANVLGWLKAAAAVVEGVDVAAENAAFEHARRTVEVPDPEAEEVNAAMQSAFDRTTDFHLHELLEQMGDEGLISDLYGREDLLEQLRAGYARRGRDFDALSAADQESAITASEEILEEVYGLLRAPDAADVPSDLEENARKHFPEDFRGAGEE